MSVAANSEKIEHIRPLKSTEDTYGLEYLYGGGDQDFHDRYHSPTKNYLG